MPVSMCVRALLLDFLLVDYWREIKIAFARARGEETRGAWDKNVILAYVSTSVRGEESAIK